jgi:hypothetical protein
MQDGDGIICQHLKCFVFFYGVPNFCESEHGPQQFEAVSLARIRARILGFSNPFKKTASTGFEFDHIKQANRHGRLGCSSDSSKRRTQHAPDCARFPNRPPL